MSPKSITYKPNSIIYFKGDIADRIFILNNGKVSLNYINIETGQELHEFIKTGEFFGVKSALGRYPREETALVLLDSNVIAFTIDEFEQLVSKNTRVIIKMLKVFSNQLRRIHKQVQNLLYKDDQINSETGLYRIGLYYFKSKKYSQALYVFHRYLVYYPSGKYSEDVTTHIHTAEDYLQKYGQGKGPVVTINDTPQEVDKPQKSRELSGIGKEYYNGINLMGEEKYEEASEVFKKIIQSNVDEEYSLKSRFEIGKCLYYMNNYDHCIKMFTVLLQKYPKHPDLSEALFFIAQSHQKKGNNDRAVSIYRKVLSLTPETDSIYRRAMKELRELERK
ncbi:MAG: tetratricopeptide repeat protein [Spirochaetales bacterium]|nr:tetratricopeptide repeat protein [Spirochaetales bacterium]